VLAGAAFTGDSWPTTVPALVSSTVAYLAGVEFLPGWGPAWLQAYVGGGVGAWLTAVRPNGGGTDVLHESNGPGLLLNGGARVAFPAGFGASAELRLATAGANVPGRGFLQTGGVQLLVGLYMAWWR